LPGERRRVAFFHEELGRLVGRAVARPAAPRQDGLPPGLRQALHGPLVGDSETERAARLGVSLATAHQYVTALYRRLGVRSRGQLFAHARRQGKTWVVP
jgi:DNA-binding NarL/FixJ family response regulator